MSVKSNKICGVCGDKANIRNYGALTCEPCKAFFRRYAFRSESIKCSSNGGCLINLMTRGFCKKCRIDKCLAIGMRKEIIRTAEEKLRQRLLIEENRLKKQKLNDCSDSVNSTTDSLIINSNDSQSIVKTDFIVELFVLDLQELDEITKTDHTVKTLVQYLKGLNGFTGMCSEDQLILVTGAYHELIAILLFDPNRPNITHQQTIRLEQQLYIYLLQRYLVMKYGLEWESRLQKLMITLRDLQVMIELRRIYQYTRNFGALTCGPCKAFYRRYALKPEEFVRNTEENERMKHLIEENKRKRKECNECTDSVDSTTSPSNLSSDESQD
ncbi:unnamed protein product [Oppiella nova]|uniref:Nuclear receptor domain-containing protein n=1 Tax=Oppiella nova TaxID=334625 RepID=A0A7R9LHR6_9ACAR|nr:unnamed protein product [Oppiella nova]CAG2163763.1 unnamed protein product [Oppiella nova]